MSWRRDLLRDIWLFRYVPSVQVSRGLGWSRKVAQRRLRLAEGVDEAVVLSRRSVSLV